MRGEVNNGPALRFETGPLITVIHRDRERLGFAEKTIMKISGHKAASVFRRYDIVDEADLAEVAAALDRKREADQSQLRHNLPAEKKQPQAEQQQDARIQ